METPNNQPNEVQIEAQPTGPLATKFGNDPAKLEEAYVNLEKAFSSRTQGNPSEAATSPTEAPNQSTEATPPNTEQQSSTTPTGGFGEAITSAVTAAGLSMDTVQQEFQSETGLSDATRDALNKTFGEQAVNAYLKGIEADAQEQSKAADETSNKIIQSLGSEQNWSTVQQWAVTNRPDLVDAFNASLDAGTMAALPVMAEAMKVAYEGSNGTLNVSSIKQGTAPVSGQSQAFKSTQEMVKAMSDPRYKNDPAYREEVAARLAVTKMG